MDTTTIIIAAVVIAMCLLPVLLFSRSKDNQEDKDQSDLQK